VSTLGYLGFLAGPPLVGALAELTSLPVALGAVAACAAATATLAGATARTSVDSRLAAAAEPVRA
jgi:hypothetical protein